MEGRTIHGEASPAYARRKAVLRNRAVRLSLERAEARIVASPKDLTRRFLRADGSIVDRNEPGLLLAYEETDADTLTWIDWFDLLGRPELGD
jgi:cell wall assembly regulator SMI1